MARPRKYKTAQELEAAIDAYFTACEGEILLDKDGEPVLFRGSPVMVGQRPPTVTGLAYALGFSGRQTLLNYQGRKPFMDAITRAKLRIEAYTEERLFDKDGANGARFSLANNFSGWRMAPDRAAQPQGEAPKIIDDIPEGG